MSTVVLTLVVVGGSIAVATWVAVSGERKPATEPPVRHRARRRAAEGRPVGRAVVDGVPVRPGLLTRLRAGLTLVAIMAMIGAVIALGLVAGVEVLSRSLEAAVQ